MQVFLKLEKDKLKVSCYIVHIFNVIGFRIHKILNQNTFIIYLLSVTADNISSSKYWDHFSEEIALFRLVAPCGLQIAVSSALTMSIVCVCDS